MTIYRLVLWKNGKYWCSIQSETPWAEEAINDIVEKFIGDKDYRCELSISTQQACIIESRPEGARLISRQPIFDDPKPIPL